jgi:hypothetical protein
MNRHNQFSTRRWEYRSRCELILLHSGSLNLDPAKIRVFSNEFYNFEAPEKRKAHPGAEAAFAVAYAIGFYLILDARKRIQKNSDFA